MVPTAHDFDKLRESFAANNVQPSRIATLTPMRDQAWFRDLNGSFNRAHWVSAEQVGEVMAHRWANADLNLHEWIVVYFSEVRTYDFIYKHACHIAAALGLSVQKTLDALFIRIFVETDEGFDIERMFAEQFTALGGETIRKTTSEEELRYHLDFVGATVGVQVKPDSFLVPARGRQALQRDQLRNFKGNRLFEQMTGKRVMYVTHRSIREGVPQMIPLSGAERMTGLAVDALKRAA